MTPRMLRFGGSCCCHALSVLPFLLCVCVHAQSTGDPQAITFVSGALVALTGGSAVTDAKIDGAVSYVAGSDAQSGSVTLEVLGHLASRATLNLSDGPHVEIENDKKMAWAGPDGQQHLQALHNSLTPASWFFPALIVQGLVKDSSYSLAYSGTGDLAGISVQHIRASRVLAATSDPQTASLVAGLTAIDLYLGSNTLLPSAVEFNIHPDKDAGVNIGVRIEFSDYRDVNGVKVPFHIKKFLQNTLYLDISVANVSVNSGLPQSDFEIQ